MSILRMVQSILQEEEPRYLFFDEISTTKLRF